jgi:hypothetical protein
VSVVVCGQGGAKTKNPSKSQRRDFSTFFYLKNVKKPKVLKLLPPLMQMGYIATMMIKWIWDVDWKNHAKFSLSLFFLIVFIF